MSFHDYNEIGFYGIRLLNGFSCSSTGRQESLSIVDPVGPHRAVFGAICRTSFPVEKSLAWAIRFELELDRKAFTLALDLDDSSLVDRWEDGIEPVPENIQRRMKCILLKELEIGASRSDNLGFAELHVVDLPLLFEYSDLQWNWICCPAE